MTSDYTNRFIEAVEATVTNSVGGSRYSMSTAETVFVKWAIQNAKTHQWVATEIVKARLGSRQLHSALDALIFAFDKSEDEPLPFIA